MVQLNNRISQAPLKSWILFCKVIVWELLFPYWLTHYPFQLCIPRLAWWIPTKRDVQCSLQEFRVSQWKNIARLMASGPCSGGGSLSGSHFKSVIFSPQLPALRA